ncbi:peptidylprolyl isomerase [bacterium]|nr:peptidylprolyl isomerase [bacterium]MCK4436415.1 peptidylprolyl isomerase [bacterium]
MRKGLLILVCLLSFAGLSQAEVVERIVAVVDGEVITLSELEEFLGPLQAQIDRAYMGEELNERRQEAQQQALERLIEERILLQEAKNRDIEVREDRIERRLEEVRGRFSSEEEFGEALNSENLSLQRLKKRIEEELMVQRLVDWEVRSKIRVGGEESREFYRENKGRFKEPGEAELSHILIRVEEETVRAEAERRGNDILAKLKEGADFSLLAKECSDGPNRERGGKLGFLAQGEILPKFEEAVSKMDVGETSGLIKTEAGFHIIKLEGRKAARQKELSEVRDKIERLLFAEKADKRYREWVEKLRQKAYIDIK